MKKIFILFFLFALFPCYAQTNRTTIHNGVLQDNLNGNGQSITNVNTNSANVINNSSGVPWLYQTNEGSSTESETFWNTFWGMGIKVLNNSINLDGNIAGNGTQNDLPNQTLVDTNSILTAILGAQLFAPIGGSTAPITNIIAGAGLSASTNAPTSTVTIGTNGGQIATNFLPPNLAAVAANNGANLNGVQPTNATLTYLSLYATNGFTYATQFIAFTNSLGTMAFQPTNVPTIANGNFSGTNNFLQNASGSNAEIVFLGNLSFPGQPAIIIGDRNLLAFSSDVVTANAVYTPNHTGSEGELGFGSPRIALGFGVPVPGGGGALQLGQSIGSSNATTAYIYMQPSKKPTFTTDLLGYGMTLVSLAAYYNGTSTIQSAMGFRASASDTNGTAQYDFFDPTFANLSGTSAGPQYNELPGVYAASIRAGTNANTTGLIIHGSLTHDVAVLTQTSTNFAINFDGTNSIVLNVFENLNLSAVAATPFLRTNQENEVALDIYPGLSSYLLTVPTNWFTNSIFSTNLAGSQIMRLKVRQQIFAGVTNYYVDQSAYNYYPAYDVDALKFFTALVGAGGSLTATQSNAVNQLVVNEKNDGSWYSNIVIYPLVGGTTNSMSWNLRNTNTYRIAWSGTLTTNQNGITGDGSTGFGNTQFTPSGDGVYYGLNSASLCVYQGLASVNSGGEFIGGYDSGFANSSGIGQASSLQISVAINGGAQLANGFTTYDGYFCATATGSTLYNYFPGGSGSQAQSPSGLSTHQTWILSLNANGSNNHPSNGRLEYVAIGGYKSPTMEANEASDVLVFEQTLGRQ